MHITHPFANVADVLTFIIIGAFALVVVVMLISFTVFRSDPNVGLVVAMPLVCGAVLALGFVLGFRIADGSAAVGSLKTQATHRYHLNLTDDQANKLLEPPDNDNSQIVSVNGKPANLYGSATDGTKLITLVKQGNTYLLTGSNLTELPHA